MKNVFFLVAVTLCFSPLSEAVCAEQPGAVHKLPSPVAADAKIVCKVNGKPLYQQQLQPLVKKALAKYQKYNGGKSTPDFEKRTTLGELKKLIDNELVRQASNGIDLPGLGQMVEQRLKEYEAAMLTNGQQFNVNDPSQREQVRESILKDQWIKSRGLNSIKVSDTEISNYYKANAQSFKQEETVKVSHILIALNEADSAAEISQKHKKAVELRALLTTGKDFAEVASTNSTCSTAKSGGDLGFIKRGYMPKEFDQVAFTANPGETSDPIRTQYGFHIIKVVEKKPEMTTPLSEVRDFIEKFLVSEKRVKEYEKAVNELRSKAVIEVLIN